MIRNNEYRDKLVSEIKALEIFKSNEGSINLCKLRLQEYDRLHPECVQVESVMIRDKRGYKDAPPFMQGCVTLFDNVNGCNITVIDNALNIELK